MTQQPQAKYRHDYRAPDYQITDIDLTFDLDAQKTVVTAVSQAVRHGASDAPLRLNGEDLKLVFILMMSRGPPGKKKRAHWSSVICRSVLRLRSLMK